MGSSTAGAMTGTLVAFHAHPDDEAIFTGGTILAAAAAGWRVVIVFATSGEEGAPPIVLRHDTGACRRAEAERAGQLLGAARVCFLSYRDSGVSGTASNRHPDSLAATDPRRAARALRRILVEERASVLTTYDANGIYGHPDHVRVHEIGGLAAASLPCDVYESTLSRPELRRVRDDMLARGLHPDAWPSAAVDTLGCPDESELVGVDVTAWLPLKLAAMAAHGSQVAEAPAFMGIPAGAFHRLLPTEWFRPARVVQGSFAALMGERALSA